MINTSKTSTYLRSNSMQKNDAYRDALVVYTAKGTETVPCDKLEPRPDYTSFSICIRNIYTDAQIGFIQSFENRENMKYYYSNLDEIITITKTFVANNGQALTFAQPTADAQLSELNYGDSKLFVANYATPSDAFLNHYQIALTDGYAINHPANPFNMNNMIGISIGAAIFGCCLAGCLWTIKKTCEIPASNLRNPLLIPAHEINPLLIHAHEIEEISEVPIEEISEIKS